ncbi:UDP-N-acetylmuramoyl-tripeptide--D-alanyl-D-alanine ligase [Patescibacteria group bacterium]|nr:UDP-N-acetylmuramoyl-tripeptide--D-alanyl-D-alanine ligase [Patescibacteria group bacterium]MBU0964569.1 UDP-N-acetylmuramoyl-tripeptide--D-alanyl-D-alanine ligase [Patescibacteria group bacterium]
MIKKIIEWKLRVLAKWVLKKYKPRVIGITGSVGKTSTKEAIYTVLSPKFRVWKNIKNYNNELGVPLSILGKESGFKNPLAWVWIFLYGLGLVLFRKKDYPEILVLEMGADKPGDIKYLTKLAPCQIGVITAIGQVHTEFFGSLEKVINEKQTIISHLKKDDFAILNIDDTLVNQIQEKTRAQVVSFGFSEQAMVQAAEVDVSTGPSPEPWANDEIKGLSFKLIHDGSSVPVFLPGVFGQHQVYSALAAAAVGLSMGLNKAEISEALKNYKSPPGRMHLISGIKHTAIIDDTYNSSPMSVKAALKVLEKIEVPGKKFAALGDMLELGDYTVPGHEEVGDAAAQVVDVLITVGERSKATAKAALIAGMPENNVFSFGTTEMAGKFIQQRIKQGDIILIKGSQGTRMERVVKELMVEPMKAKELLVRQNPEWE